MPQDRTPAPEASVALHRLMSPDDPAFQSLIDIYTEAHPPSERKPLSLLLAMFQRPDYLFEVITLAQTVVGFAIIICFPHTDACLLEYMAITGQKRGLGLGSSLFRHAIQLPEVAPRFLLAEVDSDHVPSPDRPDRIRRKRFYRDLGCREVAGLDFIMPPVSSSSPPAMNLMVFRRDLPPEIAKEHLKAWLQAIYTDVYARPFTDRRIDGMLTPLPAAAELI